jgi:hypothetical protein
MPRSNLWLLCFVIVSLAPTAHGQSGPCQWVQRTPATSPPPTSPYDGAYDAARGVTVVPTWTAAVGRVTWLWDGQDWSAGPPNPGGERMWSLAYDSARSVVVMFAWGELPEVYEWDGSSWRSVQGLPAAGRTWTALAYDSSRGVTVLFGGLADQGGALRDTWEWDGQRWTEQFPATSPPATSNHAMAFDSRRGVVVLFSGQGNSGNTWEYDGQTWTLVAQSGPVSRVRHSMAYDSDRGVVVLFGGSNGGFRLNDMWEWDGVQWLQAATPLGPAARMDHAMAYDSQRGRIVMFGGLDQNRGTRLRALLPRLQRRRRPGLLRLPLLPGLLPGPGPLRRLRREPRPGLLRLPVLPERVPGGVSVDAGVEGTVWFDPATCTNGSARGRRRSPRPRGVSGAAGGRSARRGTTPPAGSRSAA